MQVAQRIRGSVSSKQAGYEDILCPLVAAACIDVCPKNAANFNVDNVRVCKIPGSGVHDCRIVRGVVIKRDTEGVVKNVKDAKVAVFVQGVDTSSTETKVMVILSPGAIQTCTAAGPSVHEPCILQPGCGCGPCKHAVRLCWAPTPPASC